MFTSLTTVVASSGIGTGSRASTQVVQLAGPLDQITEWVTEWGTALKLLGGAVLVICMVLVGIKLGAKSVTNGGAGANTGQREALGAIFGLLIAGVLIGGALIIVPLFIGVGENSGATLEPPPAPVTVQQNA